MAKRGPKEMSTDHKEAMAKGRAEGRVVGAYLEALRTSKPKRGRKRTPESIQQRLDKIGEALEGASAIEELRLLQERRDLTAELESMENATDITELENEFVDVAKSYGSRKNISYATWREFGVPAATLKRAGVTRSS